MVKREIKFRGMLRSGEWVYGGYVQISSGAHCILSGECASSWVGDEVTNTLQFNAVKYKTVGQYTGLKDKNGQEIYEGDIIQFYDRGNMLDNNLLPCTAQVVMKYAQWFPKPINVKGLRGFEFRGYDWKDEGCEVIGNIYESPELLEQK